MKVRDMKRFLHEHGWAYSYTRGGHHQYEHPRLAGKVTVAGHYSDEVTPAIEASILNTRD
jgi:predicted RNA binding protein YcfA (HicA-like mRNA interferase family)